MKDEYDFSNAKRASDVPHLNSLRATQSQKTRSSIMLDNDVIEGFKARASEHGTGYQTEINSVLREVLQQGTLEEVMRRVIRDELKHA